VLWWRTFFRGLGVCAALLALAAGLQLILGAARDQQYALGHLQRALQLTPMHLYLAVPLGLSVSALVAARGRRRTRARSVAVVALCLLGLLTLELNLRLSHARDYEETRSFPRLGWWTGEDPSGKPRWLGGVGGVPFSLTPQGIRGREPTPHRYDGRRAVCLGDSFTWANGVGDLENWTVPAAQELGFPLLNASMHAYGVDQMATLYADRIANRFDHSEVVVSVILDDAYRACERFFWIYRKPYTPVGGEVEPCPGPLRWGRFALAPEWQVLRPWRRNAGHLLRALGLLPDYRAHFGDAVARIVAAAGSRPVYLQTFSTPFDGGRYNDELVQIARQAGVADARAIDLSGHYLPSDGHPTVEGHRRIAAQVADMLGGD
jgi:hypothetical protein